MLPSSWDDLFYLMKKEVQNHPELPNFTIPQLKQINKLFWINTKELMRDESSEISLPTFLRIVPNKQALERYEKSRKVLNNGPSPTEPTTRESSEEP